jgi:HPt (histidine-containing phosphotransfer) domain-containing protein
VDDAQQIQEKLRSLGERYLRRTYSEMDQLGAAVADLRAGSPGALKEIERMMHKIHGSGAMFGFSEISACAGRGEMLCVSNPQEASIADTLASYVEELRSQVQAAASVRKVSLEDASAPPVAG